MKKNKDKLMITKKNVIKDLNRIQVLSDHMYLYFKNVGDEDEAYGFSVLRGKPQLAIMNVKKAKSVSAVNQIWVNFKRNPYDVTFKGNALDFEKENGITR
jgi:hypothetical protein